MLHSTESLDRDQKTQTRAALDQLLALLRACNHTTRGQVISVLSALRGPDVLDETVKRQTTAVIRAAAFQEIGDCFGVSNERTNIVRIPDSWCTMQTKDYHFYTHVIAAAKALGLEVQLDRDQEQVEGPLEICGEKFLNDYQHALSCALLRGHFGAHDADG